VEVASEEKRNVVASGKTVDDAIANGLAMLGVRRDQVTVEVIKEGSRGVLGFGAENAQVRLLVKSAPKPRPPEPAVSREPERAVPPQRERAIPSQPERAVPSQPERAVPPQRERGAPQQPEQAVSVPPSAHEAMAEMEESMEGQIGSEVLSEVLTLMGIHAQVEILQSDELAEDGESPAPVLNITGDDLGILIGRRGETLRALQYLLRLMVSHRLKHWTNLIVDVEGYRVRRQQALRSLANRVAERVAQTGRSQALEPMPAYERRIVHMTLRNHPHVRTQSVGEGERRKVTIIPKR
jgi:spoIIIJ-associated protein